MARHNAQRLFKTNHIFRNSKNSCKFGVLKQYVSNHKMKAKYLNLFTDFGFKKIFGEEASKPLLIDFLNALLPQTDKIVDLTFKNNEQLGQTDLDRRAIYDIYCENEKGEKFIVELQKAKQNYF